MLFLLRNWHLLFKLFFKLAIIKLIPWIICTSANTVTHSAGVLSNTTVINISSHTM